MNKHQKHLNHVDRVKLVPANKTMKPFYEKNVEVQGKVVGVLRKEI
jgi:SOS-response transcriptional repressor LexA